MVHDPPILVTVSGECIKAKFEGEIRPQPPAIWHVFELTDLVSGRGERTMALIASETLKLMPLYEPRIDRVRWNVIRRAMDEVRFEMLDFHRNFVPISESSFEERHPPATDEGIRQFIINKAYWVSYRYSGSSPVQFDAQFDLDYLGVDPRKVRHHAELLARQGLLQIASTHGMGKPTAQLIETYEQEEAPEVRDEKVIAEGTTFQARRIIASILNSARAEIFVADNYLDPQVLNMLAAVPSQPGLKLLTFRPSAAFKHAARLLRLQRGRSLEVRVHDATLHDRVIVIDNREYYLLGSSIKDWGNKLSLLTKIREPFTIGKLRDELDRTWAATAPLIES